MVRKSGKNRENYQHYREKSEFSCSHPPLIYREFLNINYAENNMLEIHFVESGTFDALKSANDKP